MYRFGNGYCYNYRVCRVNFHMQQLPFDKRSGKIWFNNELCEWQDARVHIISHGMHYASLVFEGLRVYNTKVFKLDEHIERLFNSARILDMKIPYSNQEIVEATKKLVSDQDIKEGYIRPFAWRGSEMMGVSAQNTKINVAIAIWDWPTYFDPTLKLKGIKLNISKWQRPPQNSSPWQSKAAGLYMICTLSKHQAEKEGYTDSLMLDHEGNIAEATSANIFFKDKNNELHTPIPDSFLDGITRKTVIDLAKSKNIKINERKISPNELSNFVGCFITGTAAEITPVANILDNKFEVCDLIKDLSSGYEMLVGKNS
jgi:branched-chain amino acid aminotransferase